MCCIPQRRAGACSRRFAGKSNFVFEKLKRLLRRSLRAKALGFVRSAKLHFQNFVSLALAQDDVLRGRSRWADVEKYSVYTDFGPLIHHAERGPPSPQGKACFVPPYTSWCVAVNFAFCMAIHTVANCRFSNV